MKYINCRQEPPTSPGIPPLGAAATSSTSAPPVQTSSAPASGVSASADLQLPGKKLSVLPIGLGVFAGISVIALIVVGLVTYERTKYRKVCLFPRFPIISSMAHFIVSFFLRRSGNVNLRNREPRWVTVEWCTRVNHYHIVLFFWWGLTTLISPRCFISLHSFSIVLR